MNKRSAGRLAMGGLAVFAIAAVPMHSDRVFAIPRSTSTINGTYELTKHVMPNGAVNRPPAWAALYMMDRGRFSLNLFFRKPDGTLASESSIGRYTFTSTRYCEWITYTTRNNLDRQGVSNAPPALKHHCTPVTTSDGEFRFSPPGENVDVSFGRFGFVANIDGGGRDYWSKIR